MLVLILMLMVLVLMSRCHDQRGDKKQEKDPFDLIPLILLFRLILSKTDPKNSKMLILMLMVLLMS